MPSSTSSNIPSAVSSHTAAIPSVLEEIQQVVNFLIELDKLKAVMRKTRPQFIERYENSAEHSWQVTIAALVLQKFAAAPIDVNRVMRMLLIHDLGEIDVGDTIVYQSLTQAQQAAERAGVARVLTMLPEAMQTEYLTLWDEFEAGQSNDAKFAKALDRALPLLHNIFDNGHSWQNYGIARQQIETINKQRILAGCPALWEYVEPLLDEGEQQGWFDQSL